MNVAKILSKPYTIAQKRPMVVLALGCMTFMYLPAIADTGIQEAGQLII